MIAIREASGKRDGVSERVLVAHQPYASRTIGTAVHASQRFEVVQFVRDIPERSLLVHDRIDFVLASAEALRDFIRTPHNVRVNGGDRSTLVLVLKADELGDALDVIDACDGVVFLDLNLPYIGDLMLLAEQRLIAIPEGLLPSVVTDQLRGTLVRNLSIRERRVLILMGRALTNEQIAARLSVTTATIKNLARIILLTLRFRNRTEAAVFLSRRRTRRLA